MAKKTYSEKLQDPRWQRKRLEIMQRDDFKCTKCGDSKSSLHVHHKKYTNVNPWEYLDSDLTTLCKSCHEDEHYEIKMIEDGILKVSDFVKAHPEVTKLFTCIENHEGMWELTVHDNAYFQYPDFKYTDYQYKVFTAIESLITWLDKKGGFDKYIHIASKLYGYRRGVICGRIHVSAGDSYMQEINFYDEIKKIMADPRRKYS